MEKLAIIFVLSLSLMGAKCEQGSSIQSADPAWCKTHYKTQDTCEKNTDCKWDGSACRAK